MRGRVEFEGAALGGDLVIVRAAGTPLYHFTVVVDDGHVTITSERQPTAEQLLERIDLARVVREALEG